MPIRFRKSITIFPGLRINLSRRGVSASAGIPGTGVYYQTRHRGLAARGKPLDHPSGELPPVVYVPVDEAKPQHGSAHGCLTAVAIVLGIFLVVIVLGIFLKRPRPQPPVMGASWRVVGGPAEEEPPVPQAVNRLASDNDRSPGESSRCTALTRKGRPCKNLVIGGGRCHVHR